MIFITFIVKNLMLILISDLNIMIIRPQIIYFTILDLIHDFVLILKIR